MKNIILFIFTIVFLLLGNTKGQVKELELVKATDEIFIIYGTGGNISFYLTETGIAVFDSGVFPSEGEKTMEFISNLSDEQIKYLILTHCHYDHINGAGEFSHDTEIIAHCNTAELIDSYTSKENKKNKEKASEFIGINSDRIEELKKNSKDFTREKELDKIFRFAVSKFEGVKKIEIDKLLIDTESIYLDGKEIQLIYAGPAHTNGDIAVYIPDQKFLIAGDLVITDIIPIAREENYANIHNWVKILKELQKYDIQYLLPGHGVLTNKDALQTQIDYFTSIINGVTSMISEGKSKEQVINDLRITKYEHYHDYSEHFSSNVAKVYDEIISANY